MLSEKKEDALQNICNASPLRRDNAYLQSCSKRKRKYWVLQRNDTFKFKITPDRHNAIQNLNNYDLPDPRHFSLPSTFKQASTIARDRYLMNVKFYEYVNEIKKKKFSKKCEGVEPTTLWLPDPSSTIFTITFSNNAWNFF